MHSVSKIFRMMFLLLWLGLFASAAQAQNGGITFFEGSWEEVLQTAKEERKLIFVDAYTTWCGPCKMMSRNTFTDEAVGRVYNKNFVNYKFDMEKGEGPAWAMKYGVTAYPSLYYLDFRGEVVHKAVGYRAPDKFLDEASTALKPENLAAYNDLKYKDGDLEGDKLLAYALKQKADGNDYKDAASKYFESRSKKQMFSKTGWEAIRELTTDLYSDEFQLLIKKRKKFIKQVGPAEVEAKITDVFKKHALKYAISGDDASYQELVEMAEKKVKDKGKTAMRIKITFAEARKNWDLYARSVADYFEEYTTTDVKDLKGIVGNFYKHVEKEEYLQTANRLCRQLCSLDNTYENNDLYARLLYKAGDYPQAYQIANKAISIAQDNLLDYEETESLLREIRMKMN
jgi:thioredoxin-related protein